MHRHHKILQEVSKLSIFFLQLNQKTKSFDKVYILSVFVSKLSRIRTVHDKSNRNYCHGYFSTEKNN